MQYFTDRNPKIYQHSSSNYLHLRRLLNDTGSSISRLPPADLSVWPNHKSRHHQKFTSPQSL